MSSNISSFSIEDLISLKDNRKWFHLCDLIPEIINDHNSEEILSIFLQNISQYHPASLVHATLSLSKHFSPEKSIEIISNSISSIKESNMYSGNFKMEIVNLEIQKCILQVQTDQLNDIESQIFKFKEFEMTPEVYKLFNFLAFLYYEKSGNHENCVKYLLEYVKKNNEEINNLELLAKYSLVSRKFFNFIEIFSLKNFDKINEDIYKIYIAVQEGNTKLVDKYIKIIHNIFGDKYQIVREKAYFIGLINLCFKENKRILGFEKIQEELEIREEEINGFLLKALGFGLIKGWIDDKNKVLYFNTIIPRCLQEAELNKMKNKFGEWKEKIRQAIEMIEQ
ncbi:proteasome subunit RPN9 (RPN9) [Vairimorpha necatrix]|uniref:Proteasome subunit RPN9 (RPN9) n=1 Tax=Vairimorpha necatrix TaxID=6039 RepID=A0AAX4JAU2_9MICR